MCAAAVMRLATFTSLIALALASPLPDDNSLLRCINLFDAFGVPCPTLAPHHIFCDNLPGVRAGTGASQTRKKREDPPKSLSNTPPILYPRKPFDGTTYCEAHTNTFIVVVSSAANAAVSTFLNDCLTAVQRTIAGGQTGLIPSSGWRQLGRNAMSIVVYSEADYQTTYGVLQSAIQALIDWMSNEGIGFRTGSFTIWDGEHQVGHVTIDG